MRTDLLKAELSAQAFAVMPNILSNIVSVINDGVPRAENAEKHASNSVEYEKIQNVAVISIDGAMYKRDMSASCINVASYEKIIQSINQAEEDPSVDTIIHRVDTGGGAVAGIDEVGDRIFNSNKKTITIFENTGASAGIWGFTASDEVYATETTMLGSIGVVVTYLKNDEDDKTMTIVSKNAENKRCNLNGNCEEKIKFMINSYESIFYSRVERNTGFSSEKIKSVFNNGDMIFATEAFKSGFIDGISTFKDVLQAAIDKKPLASMPSATVAVKIENPNIKGDDMSKQITQADLDGIQAKLDEATATVVDLNKSIDAKDAEIAKIGETHAALVAAKDAEIAAMNAKQTLVTEVVAMAFEHGVNKETTLAMLKKDSLGEAGLVALNANKSNGASPKADLEEGAGASSSDALLAYAQEHKGSIQ